jgi:hypothetical protein
MPMAPLPDLPPPHMVAPYIYTQFPKAAPPQIFQPQPPPPQPPVNRQPAPPPPVEKKAQPAANVDKGALTDDVVKRLNDKLNSEDAFVRMDAAGDFMALMQRNPQLSEDPATAAIVDAFGDKIMADPSEMVRMPALMMYQLGLDKKPTQYTSSRLQELAVPTPNTDPTVPDTGEDEMATTIVQQLNNPEATITGQEQPAPSPEKEGKKKGGAEQQPPAAPVAQQAPQNILPDFIPSQNPTQNSSAGTAVPTGPPPATTNDPTAGLPPELMQQLQQAAGAQAPAGNTAQAPGLPPELLQQLQQLGAPSGAQPPVPNTIPNGMPPIMPNQPQAPSGAIPGNQLNLTSPAQQMGPLPQSPPPAGQNLNIQEGRQR